VNKMDKKKELEPVKDIAKDPEAGHLSKEQAQVKWRKQRELNARLKAYEVKARAEIEAESEEETKPETTQEVAKPIKKAKSKK